MKKFFLDDFRKIERADYGQVIKSIAYLPDQIRQVMDESRLIRIPPDYRRATKIVVSGMGGSNIGARIVKSLLMNRLQAPIAIVADYDVPNYVDKNTVYIISSYSGNTEEPLATYPEVKKRKAKILAITEHSQKNKLEKLMLRNNIPGYIFQPQYNPSNMPRLGIGYSIMGIVALLAKAGFLKIVIRDLEDIVAKMEITTRELRPEEPTENNIAKKIANQLHGKIPILVSGGFLSGNMHALRNQINESAKNLADYLTLPDLNHYALEGLMCPVSSKRNIVFLFFDSQLYHARVRRRAELTKQVIKKSGIAVLAHELRGKTMMAQAFETLQLGSWVSFYLGVLNGVDTYKIPWVDWFKKQLK